MHENDILHVDYVLLSPEAIICITCIFITEHKCGSILR